MNDQDPTFGPLEKAARVVNDRLQRDEQWTGVGDKLGCEFWRHGTHPRQDNYDEHTRRPFLAELHPSERQEQLDATGLQTSCSRRDMAMVSVSKRLSSN